jgi:S-adenosylmethionine/arginine decarboxylase-like enzyme
MKTFKNALVRADIDSARCEDPTISPSRPQASRDVPSSQSMSPIVIASRLREGKAWGLSTSIDLQECRPDIIRDAKHIESYVFELCELIGMKRYGNCQIVHFGEGKVAGYSMVQLIETSLISGHFANESNAAYLDIFSCKSYDPAIVEEFSKVFFGAQLSTKSVLLRI